MRIREYQVGKYLVREFSDNIVAHQGICHGQLTFKGTRVLVSVVMESLARPGRRIEQVAVDYRLPVEAISDALKVMAQLMCDQLRLPDPHPDQMPLAKRPKPRAAAVLDRVA